MAGKTFRGVTDEDRRKSPASSLGGGVSKGTQADYGEHGNKIGHLGNTSGSGSSGTSGSRYGGIGSGGLGSLGGGSYPSGGASGSGSGSSSSRITNDFKYSPYNPSDAVLAAKARLEELQRPGDYQSKWQDQLQASLDAILGRKAFQYDLNGDALYQQYKEQYQNLGQQAMMDTMGQAAALTGGYGSSYGQSVGQQTYDAYLQNLNDVVPELYGQAYEQYADEGTKLQNQYSMLLDRENADYSRYRDDVTDYMNELQLAMQAARNAESDDYDRYRDELSYWSGKLADEQSYYASMQKAASGGSGGSGSAQSAGGQVSAPSFGSGVEARLYNSVYNGVKVYAQQGKDTEVDRLMSTIDGGLSRGQYNKLAKLLNQYGYNLPVY